MDRVNVILERRSIRKFGRAPLEKEVLDRILDAADAAPCANGRRSWHFVVLDDRGLLDAVPSFHPYSRMILEAPLAILVCADTSVEPKEGYGVQNCSAATENILLACTAEGLGSVWLGIYPRMDRISGMKKLVGTPENIVPFSLVVIGMPGERKEPHGKCDPSRVHHNVW
ncbi:MAG: nitroreductase family protein [Candidatus Thermoplasmatota archaeon]|nr:nitroreductase family protein [Candidatus Thermoplasmatota archaeon]